MTEEEKYVQFTVKTFKEIEALLKEARKELQHNGRYIELLSRIRTHMTHCIELQKMLKEEFKDCRNYLYGDDK